VVAVLVAGACAPLGAADRRIVIEWKDGLPQGQVSVTDGTVASLSVTRGKGSVQGKSDFTAAQDGPFRLELNLDGSDARYGPGGTIVTVSAKKRPFSFLVRDVRKEAPIYIPSYGVVVTEATDSRGYDEIERDIRARGLQSKLERIESEPEETWEAAATNTRSLQCQTWLGLSRDMRIFGFSERLDWIQPRFHGQEVRLPETNDRPARYNFLMGRGWGALDKITRRLEQGVLPIVHGTLVDEDITYNVTAFVALESKPLTARNNRGTHFLVADGHGSGHMFTKEQKAE
jgi:hypothetical protein